MTPDDKWRERGESIRGASMALAIPMALAAGPLAGALAGWAVDRYIVGHGRSGLLAGLVLGFVAGIRQTARIVRQLNPPAKGPPGNSGQRDA